jgi:hypothetical protein
MRASTVLTLCFGVAFGCAALVGNARERGFAAGLEDGTRYVLADATPAVAPPVRRVPVGQMVPTGFTGGLRPAVADSVRADAIYLASPFAAGDVRVLNAPPEGRIEVALPDGRRLSATCKPQQDHKDCLRAMADGLDAAPAPRPVYVEAEPRE